MTAAARRSRPARPRNDSVPSAAPAPRPVAIANRHPRLRLSRPEVARIISLLDAARSTLAARRTAPADGELSIAFLTDAALADLHADFLDDPTPTDVITFEGQSFAGTAGEICVSVDTASRVAQDRGEDFATELTLYLVHGWLHLAGHDDLVPAKKRRMRAAERRALTLLRRHDAIPAFKLSRGKEAKHFSS